MMTKDDYQHFVCIVAGDNPDDLMKPYDRRIEEEPYIRYYYKDATKIKEKYVELYEGILNSNKETIDKEELEDIINDLKDMSDEEFYEELTEGLIIDEETGNAISTENRQGRFSYYELGKWLSVPFLLKGGKEVFQAKKKDINWDKIHLYGGDIYKRAWEMVMDDSEPENDYEHQIYENMKDKETYFRKFETKENYIISNTTFWGYAFLSDKTGWVDASDTPDQFVWMTNYYDLFIKNLPDDTLLTIYECRK